MGIKLFMNALFPYLLPYLILTQWLLRLTNQGSSTSSRTAIYLKAYGISALGGFPTGAATIAFMTKEKQLTLRESKYLLAICHAPSPLFMIGFVGYELLENTTIGWQMLLLIHSVNLVILGLFIVFLKQPSDAVLIKNDTKSSSFPLIDSMKGSIPTVLLVGTTVIFFTTISHVMAKTLLHFLHELPPILTVSLYAVLEMTSSLHIATQAFASSPYLPLWLMIILAVQGLSIHLQVAVLAKDADIPLVPYFFVRLLTIPTLSLLYWIIFL
ncbi:hypothetical protein JFL43_11410 [Viridibacillus sp. YIM B01967]|uniref:Sporulation integral membrane protein YlbJ n=1 Tax=Viridibacillus soli TaxID=2798301 RepID=A0ABS1H8L9_9BACL|nr:hypothetical protein [Viridibacillus soli]